MRKQVDLHVRTFPLGTGAGGESATYIQMSQFIRDNYLSQGWEVMSTQIAQVSAGIIYVAVTFVKYEDENVVGGSDVAEVRTKRPYHKRSEADGEQPA